MLKPRHFVFWCVFALSVFPAAILHADDDDIYRRTSQDPAAPNCLNNGNVQEINTEEVLGWKHHSANQFADRGHIWGIIVGNPKHKNDHTHFIVQIGNGQKDTIEIVYNREFGELPIQDMTGSVIEACGDYITSNKKAGYYTPSPAGAILHWVHEALGPGNHESGFLVIDGKLYGYDTSAAKANGKPKKKSQPSNRNESSSTFNYFGP